MRPGRRSFSCCWLDKRSRGSNSMRSGRSYPLSCSVATADRRSLRRPMIRGSPTCWTSFRLWDCWTPRSRHLPGIGPASYVILASTLRLQRSSWRRRLVEELGYGHLWVADERLMRNVYACLTVAALNTHRIGLGTAVTNPYTRSPALTAAAIATVDELAGGRVILGLGAGGGWASTGSTVPARLLRCARPCALSAGSPPASGSASSATSSPRTRPS